MNFKKISKLSLALLVLVSTFLTGNISVSASELNAKESFVNPVLLKEFKGSDKNELIRNRNDLKETNQTEVAVDEPIHTVVAHDEIKNDLNEVEFNPLTQLLLNEIQARAGPVSNVRTVATGFSFSWSSSSTISGANSGFASLDRIYADNELVTCSEPPTPVVPGGGYNSSEYISNATRQRLARAAVANNINGMNDETYAAWQLYQHTVMYAAEGFTVTSTDVSNLAGYFAQFEANTTSYWTKPTFNFGDGTIKSGETKTYTVTNGITSGWEVFLSSTGVTASFSNGVLTITNNNTTDDTIAIRMNKQIGSYKQLSMVYTKAGSQELVKWGVSDPDYFTTNLTNLRKGDLEIVKVDNLGNKVSGVTFDVSYNADMSSPFATVTTGTDGSIKQTGIYIGDVYIKEKTVKAPLLIDNTIHKVTILPNQTVSYKQTNQRATGTAILKKVDKDTGGTTPLGESRLDNAVFELRALENTTDTITGLQTLTKDQLIKTEVIGSDLTMTVTGLQPGRYYFIEKTESTGYLLDNEKHIVDLRYVDNATAVVKDETTSYQEVKRGNIKIQKFINTEGSGVKLPEPGAVFKIQLEKDILTMGEANAPVYATVTTNILGEAEAKDLPYAGDKGYRVTQTAAANENLGLAPYWISKVVNDGETLHYYVGNELHTSYLQVYKYDKDLGEAIVIPATFKIWSVDNNDWYTEVIGNKVIDEWTTDEKGMLITNKVMPAGDYELVESGTPTGYLDAEERIPFTIKSSNVHEVNIDGKPILVLRVSNQAPKGSVKVTKLFERIEGLYDDETLVSGWKVTYADHDVLANYDAETVLYKQGDQIVNTDSEDGLFYATEEAILEMQEIYVGAGEGTTLEFEEVVYPKGYEKAENFKVNFKKAENDNKTKVIEIEREVENKVIRTDLEIVKKDQYTDEIAKGEVFGWTMYADADLTQEILKLSTDPQTGKATLKNLPYGFEGYLVETSAPEGWYLSDEVVHVLLDENTEGLGSTYSINFYNKPKPTIGTTATGINGEKTLDPTVDNETIDVIAHENIDIDLTYVVETVAISDKVIALIEETTGKEYSSLSEAEKKETLKVAIKENPELIKARETEKDVRFETKDGEHEVKITIPANSLEDGEGLVYLEYLFNQETYNPEPTEEEPNIPVVEHEDPTDPGQTIRFEATEYTTEANKVDSVSKNNIKSKEFVFEFTGYKDGKKVESFKVNGDPKTGIATFEFAGAGTYDYIEVREVEAPKGYLLSDEVKTITMEDFDENHMYSFEYVNVLKPAAAVASGDTTQTNLFIGIFVLSLGFIVITGRKLRKVKE